MFGLCLTACLMWNHSKGGIEDLSLKEVSVFFAVVFTEL